MPACLQLGLGLGLGLGFNCAGAGKHRLGCGVCSYDIWCVIPMDVLLAGLRASSSVLQQSARRAEVALSRAVAESGPLGLGLGPGLG